MRKHLLSSTLVLPLLLSAANAGQSFRFDPDTHVFGIPSEDAGTGAYLGVDVSDVTSERLSALKLKEEKGVEITLVDQDSPAGKAGLKEHDVILTMNGAAIDSGAQLRRIIHETPPGRVVTLGLSRDGQPLNLKVPLGDRHKEFSFKYTEPKDFHVEIPPMPDMPDFDMPGMKVVVVQSPARSGLAVENLTPQLGEFFGVKDGNGVLVRSVEKGSRAEKAGIRAGDVIIKVNDQFVHDTSDFSHALRNRKGTDAVGVSLIRDKKEQNLNLALPSKESGAYQEESLEPLLNADSAVELSQHVRDQVAQMRPLLSMAEENATKLRLSPCAQKRLREQKEELKRGQEKIRRQMERLRHEMQGEWVEI